MLKAKRDSWRPISGILPLLAATIWILLWLTPLVAPKADALGQLTTRSLTLSSAVPSATGVTYNFSFTLASSSVVQGMKFIMCNSAIGTYPTGSCTVPPGVSGNGFTTATFGAQSGWTDTTHFAVDNTGGNDCTPTGNVLCVNRTSSTTEPAAAVTISFNGVKNPSSTNTAFYVGIYTYSTANYTTASRVDFGATASAVVQSLTAAASVAEVLNFCVGSTTVDDTVTSVAVDCSALSGTSLNLGTLDSSQINITPWITDGGDSQNGVAMVRSNAGNGVVVAYDAIQQPGTNHNGTLRISGATCDHPGSQVGYPTGGLDGTNDFTDPCINAAGTTQTVFTAGQEMFGMTIAGVNHGSTSSYSCSYGPNSGSTGNTCDLEPLSGYLGAGTGGGSGEYYGTSNGFAWDETGTAVNIASSASSTVKQVDDEALILKFAATPDITTPFGQYQAKMDMIAVPTY